MDEEHKIAIRNFLQNQKLAVIATSNASFQTPESALVAFAEDENLSLYFQTGCHTRKAANLKTNRNVSLVIGLSLESMITIQYEGAVSPLTTPAELAACKRRFITKKSPTTEEYFNHPSAIFFKVEPTWIGCSDYTGKTPEVFELFF